MRRHSLVRSLHPGSRGWALSRLGWIATLALCACGGEPDEARREPVAQTATAPASKPAAAVQEAVAPPAKAPVAATAEPPVVATPPAPASSSATAAPEYLLVVFRKKGLYRDTDELVPVHGAGYEPLRAFVVLRGKPRRQSPVAEVQPYCLSSTHCEYRAPRRAGLADRIMISLEDDSVARLSAADDMVVISARTLAVATPSVVKLTMTIPGQAPVTRQITYAKAPGTAS
jgi:soluble lytic murein transglycosylase-like protein